jgi:hypothetical protein
LDVKFKHPNSTCDIWESINYLIGSPIPAIGQALEIYLPKIINLNETFWLKIDHVAGQKSRALSWLSKE